MIKSSKLTSVICGLITVFVTIIVYLYAFENIFAVHMHWVSLLMLLISEIIFIVKSVSLKKNIFSVANIVTSSVHLFISVILAVIFVNFAPNAMKTYILLNVLAICGLAVADVVIIHFGTRTSVENNQKAGNMKVMDECCSRAKMLVELSGDSEYKKELEGIVDELKYADNSELTGDEAVILEKIDELVNLLKSEDKTEVSDKIAQLKNQIKIRSIKVSSNKRGSF